MVEENAPDGDEDVVAKLQAVVKTLTRDSDRLRQRLVKLESQPAATSADGEAFTDLRDRVEGFDGRLSLVEETLDTVQRTVEKLAGGTGDQGAPSVVSWADVRDPKQAALILSTLVNWVDQVAKVYLTDVFNELEKCWLDHPAVVQLLLDLWASWCGAYQTDTARVLEVWDVRRYRRTALDELKTELGNCKATHSERDGQWDWKPPAETEIAELARAWANRPRPPEPETPEDE